MTIPSLGCLAVSLDLYSLKPPCIITSRDLFNSSHISKFQNASNRPIPNDKDLGKKYRDTTQGPVPRTVP